MPRFLPINNLGFRITKKILIGVSLIIAYFLTLRLSLFLTPPYPQLLTIFDSIKNRRPDRLKIVLPAIFSLPKIAGIKRPLDYYLTPAKTSQPIFSKNQSPSVYPSINPPDAATPSAQPLLSIFPTSVESGQPLPTSISDLSPSPKPTKTPKPTKPPKPTPTPTFALTNPRPGKNIRDVAQIVGKIMCVPPAMIYAIYDNEGDNFKVEGNWTYYNTYQGSDPTDIPGSTAVFGVTQMMGDTWHRIKPYVGQKLGSTELSLNVTFDSMAAGAYHVGNISLAWKNKISCEDWPVDYILYGACRYNGACPADTFGQKQYYNSYTYSVCASYNEYGGAQKKCQ